MSDYESKTSFNGNFKLNDGDWVCTDSQCGNVNFARRKNCNRCNKERGDIPKKKKLGQEIGKVAAEKSKGLFSADDWQCNKCGNVNWARRQQCNMCNAPKFGEVEERTGLGGGYNDRGVVEYKQRHDSDDEYDEFGRRKKRRRRDDEKSNDSSTSLRSNYKESDRKSESNDSENDTKHSNKSIDLATILKERYNKEQIDNIESNRSKSDDEADDKSEKEKRESNYDEEEEDEDDDEEADLSKYDLSDWGDVTAPPVIKRT